MSTMTSRIAWWIFCQGDALAVKLLHNKRDPGNINKATLGLQEGLEMHVFMGMEKLV